MTKKIKLNFYVSTRYVGAEAEDEVELEVPIDYNCDADPQNLIQEYYEEWMYNQIECSWRVLDDNVPNYIKDGTIVMYHENSLGVIDGNDGDDTDEFDNVNYYVCPIECTNKKYWSDDYVMLRRSEFIIINE